MSDTTEEIVKAASLLASVCDGAVRSDGAGYNGADAVVAKSILKVAKKSPRQVIALHSMLRKYQKQLAGLGVDYAALVPPPMPAPGTDDRSSQKAASGKPIIRMSRISAKGVPRVLIEFPYDKRFVDAMGSVGKRWFDKDGSMSGRPKAWLVEPTLQSVQAAMGAFKALNVEINLAPDVASILEAAERAYVESRASDASFDVPTKLPPYPFQRAGIKWVDDRNGRALIADEPGLGKSLQSLGWLALRREKALPAIVLCPATLRINWLQEAAKFTDFKCAVISGKSSLKQIRKLDVDALLEPAPGYDLLIVNYDLLAVETPKVWLKMLLGTDPSASKIGFEELLMSGRQCVKLVEKEMLRLKDIESRNRLQRVLSGVRALGDRARSLRDHEHIRVYVNNMPLDDFMLAGFKTLICDEAHYLKESGAQRSMAALAISRLVPHCICLTGTPIMNRPKEIWHQTQVVNENVFPKFWDFGQNFCAGHQTRFGWDFNGASNLQELDKVMRSTIMIRRTKAQVLPELPAKTLVTIPFILDDKLEKKYRKDTESTVDRLTRLKKDRDEWRVLMGAMGDVERKKYLATHAEAALKAGKITGQMLEDLDKIKKSALDVKFDQAMKFILDSHEANGKLLVFATHHDTIDRAVSYLRKEGVKTDHIDGRVDVGQRNAIKNAFQDGDLEVLVCGIRAAGEGLTLTASHTVIFIEFDWNPSRHLQAEDRVHRISQKSAVTIYYLVAMGTIEESIVRMIDAKREVVNAAVGEGDRTIDENGIMDAMLDSILNRKAA
jgi:SNF2 family DNA or RNA helicase